MGETSLLSEVTVSRTATRTLAALLPAVALALTPLSAVSAAPKQRPSTIPLVTGSLPEGISAGPGSTFYAGARADGAVYVGNAKNGKLRTLVPGEEGEVAVGLLYDEATKRLWVAGGGTGDITAYDARSGRVLYTANLGTDRFLNDVAVTDDAVYVTDSTRAQVVVDTPDGALPTSPPRTLTLGSDYVQLTLAPDFDSTTFVRVLDEDDTPSDLDRPTTGALVDGDLYVVNGRFGTIGRTSDAGATLPFSVSRFDLP